METNKINNLLKDWVLSLIDNKPNLSLIDNNFNIDNGLSLSESINYELEQYREYSSLYDLNTNFDIKIENIYLHDNKYQVSYSVLNQYHKTIFKRYVTIIAQSGNYFISSNNYLSQIVSKYSIDYEDNQFVISGINLAIKIEQKYSLYKIISSQLEVLNISKPSSFDKDGFILVKLNYTDESISNNLLKLKIIYEKNGHYIIETRSIYLSKLNLNTPFFISEQSLCIKNQEYPFHIFVDYHSKEALNILNPRNLIIPLTTDINRVIITDCLDNDWNVIIN